MVKRICIFALLFGLLLTINRGANAQELKLEILNGHSGGGVLSVAVSADGKYALTGSTDKTALLWDLETGKQLRRFVGHEDAVSAVAFSKDGQFVLTASYDKTARLWETATGRQIRVFVENRNGTLVGHSGKILSAAISADARLVATAGEDKTARIWDLKTGKQLFEIEHAGRVNSIAFSPDSRLLLTGGEDKIARLYSTATGKEERQFVGHTGEITSVAYSPDSKQVLTGSASIYPEDNSVRLWNAENSAELKNFKAYGSLVTVAFSPNGNNVIGGNKYKTEIWDVNSGKLVQEIQESGVSLVLTPNGRQILFADSTFWVNEGRATVLEITKQFDAPKRQLLGKSGFVNDVAVSPESGFVLIGADYNTSGLWNIKSGLLSRILLKDRVFSKDSEELEKERLVKFIKSSYNRSAVALADTLAIGDHTEFSKAVGFSPDGKKFAISTILTVQIFDLFTLKEEKIFEVGNKALSRQGKNQGISTIAFSPNGEAILGGVELGFSNTGLRLWNINSGKEILKIPPQNVNKAVFSPDGKTIAIANKDKTVELWNAETGEVKRIIKDFLAPVWSVAFSPDGKTIATAGGGEVDMSKVGIGNAGNANGVRFFDVETGKQTGSFGQIYESVINKFTGFKSVAYSLDKEGRYIAAGSFDGKVYLRDNETKTLRKFEGHTDAVNSVKFAKDASGNLLVVSGSSDSTTRIWNAATGEEICALVTFRDGNWAVVQTRTGRYDAPNGGEIDGIQWVFGNETIALSQLKDIYYTPNLLPRLLGYKPDEPLKEVPALANLKLFPKIVAQNLNGKILTAKLESRGGGIGAVRVMVNGKQATADARDANLKAKPEVPNGEIVTVSFDLTGSAGLVEPIEQNKIEVTTSNYEPTIKKGNINSNAEVVSRGSQVVDEKNDEVFDCSNPSQKCPTLYAVVGGVSDYNGDKIDLKYAAKDAEDFASALGIGARRMLCPANDLKCARVQIKLLTSGDNGNLPTKKNFENAFSEIAQKAKPEDILVVYLAGHGASLDKAADNYFFLTKDAENATQTYLENNLQSVTISDKEIIDWITERKWRSDKKGIDARKQVLILDTCAAGAFANNVTLGNLRDNVPPPETARDALKPDQIRAMERLKDLTGFQILMGSSADKSSYESSRYEHGLLTYALLEGMKGAALKQDKFVDTQTLFVHTKENVKRMAGELVGGIQDPRIFGESGILIGLMNAQEDRDAIKILKSPLPVFVRPNFSLDNGTGKDTLDLTAQFRNLLEQTSDLSPRGRASSGAVNLAFVYYDNTDKLFAGAYQVTGTYAAQADGTIKLKAFLWTIENADPKPLGEISAPTAEAAVKLLEIVLKELTARK